ncbi:MAG TPA: hypothetical protein VFX96_00905 [Pyrinomonadaceae bacterium]|nr:hypothetical protein [Pyrinomonadaceae bacterium]
MNNCYLVSATTINAYWAHGLLYIGAEGHAECPQLVNISETPLTIYPPEYQVTTCACPQIGSFPYNVHAWFHLAEQPETVTVHTASGPQKVEVKTFPSDLVEDVTTPSALTDATAEGEVVGISPNSFDVGRAISDAVSKLQKLYPGNVNATLVETGVVAAGSPVGLAFLYVRMRQNEEAKKRSKAAKKRSE